jgi:hypothetical protein
MRDGAVVNADPKEITGYVAVPFAHWFESLPFS